ncbi:competence type IV pilus assembly protein ComGB [Enterococcus olivae]
MKKEVFRKSFLAILVALLENGFSLQESIEVIQRSGQFQEGQLQKFSRGLFLGETIAHCFAQIDFSVHQVVQIQLAETHGDIQHTLATMLQHMELFEKQQKELRKVAAYPVLLLFFVFSLLIGMRLFLLPPLLQSGMLPVDHWGMLFLRYAPIVLLVVLVVLGNGVLALFLYFKRRTVLEKASFFARLPLTGTLYALYQTSCFSLEWGRLFKQGLEAQQILTQMSQINPSSLLAAVAKEVDEGLSQGKTLAEQLADYRFLTLEFPLIIYQGEVKGKLGEELLLYSQLLLTKFISKVEKGIQWIQPLVFLFIAVLILAIYMAMFLPIYGNLGGMMT